MSSLYADSSAQTGGMAGAPFASQPMVSRLEDSVGRVAPQVGGQ